jgi:hypothetical protein
MRSNWPLHCRCLCLPMAELVYLKLFTVLSGAPNTQSARQTPKYCFLVVHVCCIRNIPQYWLSLAECRQSKLPFSYQLHHLVLRHLSQVVKNPPCSGFEPVTSRTRVRRSNHYTIELLYRCLLRYQSEFLTRNTRKISWCFNFSVTMTWRVCYILQIVHYLIASYMIK